MKFSKIQICIYKEKPGQDSNLGCVDQQVQRRAISIRGKMADLIRELSRLQNKSKPNSTKQNKCLRLVLC